MHAETLATIGTLEQTLLAHEQAMTEAKAASNRAIKNELLEEMRKPESWQMWLWRWAIVALLLFIGVTEVRGQQSTDFMLRIQENGTNLIQRGGGPLLTLNCNTNITCTVVGSVVTMNASGGAGGCTPAGSAGQILVDDGAGGCTSTTPTISGSTITATLSGNATTATALAANPTDCAANQFANAIAASGNLTCAQVNFTDLAGTASDAQIPNLNTLSTGLTASRCVETDGSGLLVSAAAVCGSGSGAPSDATYITQTANGSLSAEQALGALSTGCLGSTTTTGVVAARTITGTSNNITVTNGDCSGNPTLDLGSTAVQTDTANTWTTGAQDMGSVTSFKVPTSGGAAPGASGLIAIDSTRGTFKFYNDLSAASGPAVEVLSAPQNATGDTLTCAGMGAGNPTAFATTYTIPANYLIANKMIRLGLGFMSTTQTTPSMTSYIKLGSTIVWQSVAAASASQTSAGWGAAFIIQAIDAPGAAANVMTHSYGPSGSGGGGAYFTGRNTLAQPVAVATNGTLAITAVLNCSTNTAGNTYALHQFVVETLN